MELELEALNLPSDNERPIVIAGPCSAETEEQVMNTARQLRSKGCHMFRAGVWKPRTKPGGFEGCGEKALPWLKQVKDETEVLKVVERKLCLGSNKSKTRRVCWLLQRSLSPSMWNSV